MKKHIAARQVRNAALGKLDAAARCTFCRRALPKIGVLIVLAPDGQPVKFCDEHCHQSQLDAVLTREARR